MIKVTATEFKERFGKYRDNALREPVAITTHGRESLILLSADEYHRLKRRERQSLLVSELPEDELQDLLEGDWSEEGKQFDHEVEGSKD